MFDLIAKRLTDCADAESTDAWIKFCLANPLPVSPWGLWTFCSLHRHLQRQRFVADIVKNRLGGDLEKIGRKGYFGHPPGFIRGLVPELPDWEYDFHGCGCCLTNRLSGESIDVDFYDNSPDWFDDFFYTSYLRSLEQPEIWERRVLELHPSIDTVILAFEELLNAGLLKKRQDHKVVQLVFDSDLINRILEQIETECHAESKLIFIAAALGDWELVQKLSPAKQVADSVKAQCESLAAKREQYLIQIYDAENNHQEYALKGLAEMNSPRQREFLKRTFTGPLTSTISCAFKIIGKNNDDTWCNEVDTLLKRIQPDGKLPQPHLWINSMKYLLQHHSDKKQYREMLLTADAHLLAQAAILALEHFPQDAIKIFQKAIRSSIPGNRIVAAAALALINQPWSLREMIIILEESDEQELTLECRAALRETDHAELHETVRQWEQNHPHQAEKTEWITMGERYLRSVQSYIQLEMEELHDRILSIRGNIPPESIN